MIELQRIDDTIDAKVMRMREFYNVVELWDYKQKVIDAGHNTDEAFGYLDLCTRMDYLVSNRQPIIDDYLMQYLAIKKKKV